MQIFFADGNTQTEETRKHAARCLVCGRWIPIEDPAIRLQSYVNSKKIFVRFHADPSRCVTLASFTPPVTSIQTGHGAPGCRAQDPIDWDAASAASLRQLGPTVGTQGGRDNCQRGLPFETGW